MGMHPVTASASHTIQWKAAIHSSIVGITSQEVQTYHENASALIMQDEEHCSDAPPCITVTTDYTSNTFSEYVPSGGTSPTTFISIDSKAEAELCASANAP